MLLERFNAKIATDNLEADDWLAIDSYTSWKDWVKTKQQNRMNRTAYKKNKSGYKGVYWYAEKKKWLASIRFNKKSIYLGLYENKIDAALAYDQKAKELFCEFAYQNLIHA